VAFGNGAPATFHRTRYPGCSSLLSPDASVIDLFMTIGCADPGGNFHVLGTEPIGTVRFDDLSPKLVVDYLKVDIQVYELEVMRHATAALANTVVIECEVEFVPMYRGQPLFGDIQCFLRDQGFVMHKFIDVGGRAFQPLQTANPFLRISQLLWADAIFVRDFSRLDTYTDGGRLKAAAILDLVYASFDLVLLLLGEYDRRQQTDLRQRYREAMRQRMLVPKFMNIMDRPNQGLRPAGQ